MKKSGLFTWIFTATLFSVSPLTSLPAKAEGGCPKDLFPAGGGYCRNIICEGYGESSTVPVMKKYGVTCPLGTVYEATGERSPNKIYAGGKWGNIMVPMRQ